MCIQLEYIVCDTSAASVMQIYTLKKRSLQSVMQTIALQQQHGNILQHVPAIAHTCQAQGSKKQSASEH